MTLGYLQHFVISVLTVLLIFNICQGAKADQQVVYWASSSAPGTPVFKHYLNIQLGFDTQRLLFEHLPEYQVVYRPQNSTRVFKELQRETNVCTDTKIRTKERDAIGYASALPQIILRGLKFIVNQNNHLFDNTETNRKYTIEEFLQAHPNATMGAVNSRSYGSKIDADLRQLSEQNRLYQRSAEQGTIGALDMLMENWVDVILDYPPLTNHYLSQRPGHSDIRYFDLADVPEYSFGYIYCSKSKFGKTLVENLNRALATAAAERAYYDAHLSYVKNEHKQVFTETYNRIYSTDF